MKIIDTNINNQKIRVNLVEKNNTIIDSIFDKIKENRDNLFPEYINLVEKIANGNKLNTIITKDNLLFFGEDLIYDYDFEKDDDTEQFVENIKKFESLKISLPIIYYNY